MRSGDEHTQQATPRTVPRRAALVGAIGGLGYGGFGMMSAAAAGGPQEAPRLAADQTAVPAPDWTNVKSYGAVGDGVTDDTAAVQAALNATGPGGVTYLPVGAFAISAPLVIPPAVTLLGSHANRLSGSTYVTPVCYLAALPSFSGPAMLRMLDKEEGGYPLDSGGQRVTNICLEGALATTGTVGGILATGRVHDVIIDTVSVQNVTGHGVAIANYTRADGSSPHPYTWCVHNTTVSHARGDGFHLAGATDSTLVNCQSLGAGGHGFYLASMANSNVTSCRAEWSSGNGFYITGNWWNGQGSGGMVLVGCSTDRNSQHGVLLDCAGNGPMLLSGLMLRRDGRNGYPGTGGGGYAGLAAINAQNPIVVSGVVCYPGIGDDGAGVNSPQYGLSFTGNTFVSVGGAGYLHAATEAFHDGGTNTTLARGSGIGTATGPTGAPVHGPTT
jgi:hypothetical protein